MYRVVVMEGKKDGGHAIKLSKNVLSSELYYNKINHLNKCIYFKTYYYQFHRRAQWNLSNKKNIFHLTKNKTF